MNNISQESQKVLDIIKQYGPIRPIEIVKILNLSVKTVYKHLSKLLDERLVKKSGTAPKVFYSFNENFQENLSILDKGDFYFEQNYIYVSPSGEIIRGINGFQAWCNKNRFDFNREKKIFLKEIKTVYKLKKNGLISARKSILSGGNKLFLDNIFFSDFYNLGHFGKTKLGQLVYLGKTSQNKQLIAEIATIIKPGINELIKKHNIKLVCFIPPTIDRKVQFMEVLKQNLKINLPEIIAVKTIGEARIPQKTLRKLEDRIINARATIAVSPSQKINSNVLIIDDATGSGATLNETAKKIKTIASGKIKVIGYSVVGSFKGFDVISEV